MIWWPCTLAQLEPGDHIRVSRKFYYHHGLYIGKGKVIHFAMETGDGITTPENIQVLQASINDFLRGGELEKAEYSKEELPLLRPKDQVIEIAMCRLGEKGYNVLENNCEHFVNSCVYLSGKSTTQIDEMRLAVAKLLRKNKT